MPQSDAQIIATAAACLSCIPSGSQMSVQTMLLALKAGGSVDPQQLVQDAACLSCLDGMQQAVQIYLLARIAGASTDPNVLASLASCYRCLDPIQEQARSFLMCEWGQGGCVTPTIPQNISVTVPVPPSQPVIVSWNPMNPNPSFFVVGRSVNSELFQNIASLPGSSTSYQDNTPFTPTDVVCYKIKACNGTCCSDYSSSFCEQNGNAI